MDIVDLIRSKRSGNRLSDPEISWLLDAYVRGTVADEQVSALLMAIVFQGMTRDELAWWTQCMIDSGEKLDLSKVSRPTVDKHSTGGVGDKISLVLAPLIAACGAAMPQLSGRGLGHTGGTLDKMEAIPGFRVNLSPTEMMEILDSVGAVIAAAGPGLVPVDRKMYALRDVTGTVESRYLIASSIMSKKIAEGTASLVLDVKVGTGAFLPDPDEARALAELMVSLGEAHGVRTTALLTAMDTPLGRAAGNALEVVESVEVLQGGGPADVRDLTVALAREMLALAGISADPAAALDDGSAYDAWCAMVSAQGGDPYAVLPVAAHIEPVLAERDGFVTRLEARAVGIAAWRLGAGRARKEDPVSAARRHHLPGQGGRPGQRGPATDGLHTDDPERFVRAREALTGALQIGDTAPTPAAMVLDRITAG